MKRLLAALLVLLAGCITQAVPQVPATGRPPDFPAARYLDEARQGGRVFRIDPERSVAVIYVYRGGKLAHLGHNHLVMSRNVQGFVSLAEPVSASTVDFFVPVVELIVDDPNHRAMAGEDFAKVLTPQTVQGTRRNMLGARVLDAAAHPFVTGRGRVTGGALPNLDLDLALSLHGVTRSFPVAVTVERDGGTLVATGAFPLKQTDFGLVPYSVLGGKLQVADEVKIRFRLVARALE